MDICTWKGCLAAAEVEQRGRDGQRWAFLCREHEDELKAAFFKGPAKLLASWVKAQGGAEQAAKRTIEMAKRDQHG